MFIPDSVSIGVAHGSSNATDRSKVREESFAREIDSDWFETRHFELRTSP